MTHPGVCRVETEALLGTATRSALSDKARVYATRLEAALDAARGSGEIPGGGADASYLFCARELAERSAKTGAVPPSEGWALDQLAYELWSEFGRMYRSASTTVSVEIFDQGFARAVADCRRFAR